MSKEKNGEPQDKKGVQLQVEVDEAVAQGAYSNLALVAHNATEFVLDFIFVQPQQPKAKVRSRIITSPGHAKRFLHALSENISRYEQIYGPIKEVVAGPDEKEIRLH